MKERNYRNKAFLSYRHVEEDEKLAALLQSKLENYRVGRGTQRNRADQGDQRTFLLTHPGESKGTSPGSSEDGFAPGDGRDPAARPSRGVGRIFRDATDLGARADLTEELRRELDDSEYLIVLCSRAAAGSKWIEREVRYFLQSHDIGKVLPVLSDGEPEEVLPAMFAGIEGMPRHPLACDFRGSRRRALREELPRLTATLLGCPYDELVNRRQRYETRRLAAFTAAAVLLLSAVAAYYAFTSAQVRQSLTERQIGESESLAVQSGTALSQGLRFDAIRSALEALPEKEGDRPVTPQAMLALQRSVGAYVPEGSRTMGQTGEFLAPGQITDFQAGEIDGNMYVSVVYGNAETMVWNADTGERILDTAARSGLSGARRDGFGNGGSQYLAQDLLLRAVDDRLMGIELPSGELRWEVREKGSYNWQILDVEKGVAAVVLYGEEPTEDGSTGSISTGSGSSGEEPTEDGSTGSIYAGSGSSGEEPTEDGSTGSISAGSGSSGETPEESVQEGAVFLPQFQELQLRSLEDGRILFQKKTERYPDRSVSEVTADGNRIVFIEDESIYPEAPSGVSEAAETGGPGTVPAEEIPVGGGSGTVEEKTEEGAAAVPAEPAAAGENTAMAEWILGKEWFTETTERLVSLDVQTGQEKILLRKSYIIGFRMTEDGHVLAAFYEKPGFPKGFRNSSETPGGGGFETVYLYDEDRAIHVCCIDVNTGNMIWEKESGCTRNSDLVDPMLLSGLRVSGREACLFSSGSHVEILAQDSGELLDSLDLPGLPVCLAISEAWGQEALTAVLEDGSQVIYLFFNRELFRKDAVFPGPIIKMQEAGNRFFLLCGREGIRASENLLFQFGEEVFDPDASYVSAPSGEQLSRGKPGFSYLNFSGYLNNDMLIGLLNAGALAVTGDLFVVPDAEANVYGVDARTGQVRWKAAPGSAVSFAGLSESAGVMAFRDFVLDGKTRMLLQMKGEPVPDVEAWKLLYVEDGRLETVEDIAKKAFAGKKYEICKTAVGGDALDMLVFVEGKEGWILRYSLQDRSTRTLCLSRSTNKDITDMMLSCLAPSPDGTCTFCAFVDTSELCADLLVDWKTGTVTEIPDALPLDGGSAFTWSDDGSRFAIQTYDRRTALFSCDGKLLELPAGNPADGKPASTEDKDSAPEKADTDENGTEPPPDGKCTSPGEKGGAPNDASDSLKEGTEIQGIGFWKGKFFTVEKSGPEIHFRIRQEGIDFLLPETKRASEEMSSMTAKHFPAWELPGDRILLQYGSRSYILDAGTGAAEAVIDYMTDYNPDTDTFLILDDDGCPAVVPRYGWEDLVKKGNSILENCVR